MAFAILFIFATGNPLAFAQLGPDSINISGALYNPNGTPINKSSIDFKLEVWDQNLTCVLYSEEHTGVDLSASSGRFSLLLGRGTNAVNHVDLANPTSMTVAVFQNSGTVPAFTGCSSGVTLSSGDQRLIRISYNLGTGYVAMNPDVPLSSSAYALIADSISGKKLGDLVQIRSDADYSLTQANIENVFSKQNYPRLDALLNGSSSFSFNNNRLTNVAAPLLSTDAANKGYVDQNIGGKSVDLSGIGPSLGDGKFLMWDATAGKWSTGVPVIDGASLSNVNAARLQGYAVSTQAPSLNEVLKWNGSAWVASQDQGGITALTGDVAASGTGSVAATITSGAVTTAKIANAAITSAKIASGATSNLILMTDSMGGSTVSFSTCPNEGEVLKWTSALGWQCTSVASLAPVTSVAGKTGVVTLNFNDVDGLGTAAIYDVGTNANQIVKLDASARIPAVDGSLLTNVDAKRIQGQSVAASAPSNGDVLKFNSANSTWEPQAIPSAPVTSVAGRTGAVTLSVSDVFGSITSVNAGNALLGGGSSGAVTLSVNVGTGPNQVVQLDSSSRLPSVDGGSLTNVNAQRLQGRTLASTAPTTNYVLKWNGSQWEPSLDADSGGDITDVTAGNALLGGGTSGAVTLSVNVGTGPNQVVQLDSSSRLPAVDGGSLINVNAQRLQGRTLASTTPTPSQVLSWNGSTSQWEPTTPSTGSVTSVSVNSANGLGGSVATATTTPAITLTTSVNGIAKGNGTGFSAATAGTDYSAGTSALTTGILKSTTGTGALSIAGSSDITAALGYTPVDRAGLTSGQMWVGNASNLATAVSMSGDGSLSNTGALTVSKVNGVTYPSAPATSTFPLVTGANTVTYTATSADTFSQYALLAGRTGGQTLNGGSAASDSLTLDSTTNSTKGRVVIAPTGGNVGIGTTSPSELLEVNGAIKLGVNASQVAIAFPNSGALRTGLTGTSVFFDVGRLYIRDGNASSSNARLDVAGSMAVGYPGTTPPSNGFIVSGNVGIGTATPSSRLEVSSGVANTSGLKFTNLTSTSPIGTGTPVGVDSSGNLITIASGGSGTVTSVSVVSANGLGGSVATASTTPAITLTTSVNGMVKGNGTAFSAAAAGTDFSAGTSALATGILKSTTGTGALSIAGSADITSALGYTPVDRAGLTSGQMWVGNASNLATAVSMSGDGSLSNTGALTVSKVNGVTYPSAPATSTFPIVTGSNTVTYTATSADTFSQYALLAGRTGGQTLNGGSAASESLTLDSTANSTKGRVLIAPTGGNVGIGTTSPGDRLSVVGGNIELRDPTTQNPPLLNFVDTTGTLSIGKLTTNTLYASQRWKVGQGTVGSPGLGFTSDQASGVYLPATSNLGVVTAGSERLRIDSSGNVGIGTTSPGAKLEVSSGVANTSGLKFTNFTSTTPVGTGTPVGVDSSGNLITITSGGSGTVTSVSVTSANGLGGTVATASTTPAITLTTSVNGIAKGNGTGFSAATAGTDYSAGTAALTTGLLKSTTGTGALSIAGSSDITSALGYTPVDRAGLTSGQMWVGNASNLATAVSMSGDGSLSNTGALTVSKVNGVTYPSAPATSTFPLVTGANTVTYTATSADTFSQYALLAGRTGGQTLNGGDAATNNLTFDSTSNATKGYILLAPSGGNVGIGTTSPAARLDIAGSYSGASWSTSGPTLQTQAATYTDTSSAASTTIPVRAANSIGSPTFSSSNAITITYPASVYVGAPVVGTNTTFTFPVAIYANGGGYFNGSGYFTGETSVNSLFSLKGSPTGTREVFFSRAATNSLAIGTANTERMRIDASGNVGIGTATPSAKLEVSSGVANTSGLKFTNFTSTAPVGTGTPVGVDSSGNLITITSGGSGTVTSVSVTSANGLGGTVATATTTPAITLTTSVNGIAKGNGTSFSAAGPADITTTLGYTPVNKAGDNMSGNLTYAASTGSIYTAGSGANTVTVQGPSGSIGTSYVLRLPTAQGSASTYLQNDGSGNLTWASPSGVSPVGASLTSGQIWVGSATNVAAAVAVSGDAALSNAGAVTVSKVNGVSYPSAPATSTFPLVTASNTVTYTATSADTFTQYALLAGRVGGQSIKGGTAANNNLTLDSTSNSTKGYVNIAPLGGNVGIGTDTPATNLEIVGSTATLRVSSSTGTNPGLQLNPPAGQIGYAGTITSTPLALTTNGAERMRIDSTGKVGIGTTTPGTLLDVSGAITSRPYGATAGQTGQVVLRELAANGTSGVTIKAPDLLAADLNLVLPATNGTNGQVLTTDGAGTLSWSTVSGGVSYPLAGSLGSAAAPTYSFSGDTNNGWFSPGADLLSASTNGVERLRIDASGNVGIGTTSPGSPLTVSSSTATYTINASNTLGGTGVYATAITGGVGVTGVITSGALQGAGVWGQDTAGAASANYGVKGSSNSAGGAGVIGITSSATGYGGYFDNSGNGGYALVTQRGNVGIGTTTPTAKLEISSGVANTSGLKFTNFTSTTPTGTGTAVGVDSSGNLITIASGGGSSQWTTNGSNIYYNSGNVGIGTTAPSEALQIYKTSGNSGIQVTATAGRTFLGLFSGSSSAGQKLKTIINESGSLKFGKTDDNWTTETTQMLITDSGNVGIGTTSPTQALDVNGKIAAGGSQVIYNANSTYTGSIFFGDGGASLTTGGNSNTGVGLRALNSVTSGSGNVAVGSGALFSNLTGANNAAFGTAALYSNTGSVNSAFGASALYYNTSGGFNTAVGYYAMQANTTGNYNTAIGHNALMSNTTGSNNSAIGYRAGRFIANGTTANATSGTSVYLGTDTKALADGGANEIVIGYDATGFGSNTAVLGNSSIVTTVLRGNVGIGTTTPTAKLEISSGVANTSGLKFTNFTSTTPTGTGTAVGVDSSGNLITIVGGGSTTPGGSNQQIQYNSSGAFAGSATHLWDNTNTKMTVGNITTAFTVNPTILIGSGNAATYTPTLLLANTRSGAHVQSADSLGRVDFQGANGTTTARVNAVATETHTNFVGGSALAFSTNANGGYVLTEKMRIDQNGNVGIGTTTPSSKLELASSGAAGTYSATNSGIMIKSSGGNEMLRIYASDPYAANFNSANLYIGAFAGASNPSDNTSAGYYNTGVGYQTLMANTTGAANTAMGMLALDSNTTGGENVAMGKEALTANGSGSGSTGVGYQALASSTGNYNSGFGRYAGWDITSGTNNTIVGMNTGRGITTGSNNTIIGAGVTGLAAGLANNIIIADGAGNRRINVDSSGNVGIGTTVPGAILDVNGTGVQSALIVPRDTTANRPTTPVNGMIRYNTTSTSFEGYANGAWGSLGSGGSSQWTTSGSNIYYNTGNVGIGTISPTQKLNVVTASGVQASFDSSGANGAKIIINNTGGGNASVLEFQDATTAKFLIGKQTDNSFFLYDNANARDALRIASGNLLLAPVGGNVGIGTTSPGSPLTVSSSTATYTINASNTLGGTGVYATAITGGVGVTGVITSGALQGAGVWGQDTAGAASANYGVKGSSNSAGGAGVIGITSSATGYGGYFDNSGNGGYALVTQRGNVGIGTTTPGTQLDVNGAITSRPAGTGAGQTGQVILRELAANGTNSVTIKSPDLIASNLTLVLPTTSGTSGQVLSTDGAGNLSWSSAAVSYPLAGSLGSAAAPTYSFTGDTDTGWFSPGAGILAATTNGTERVRIDASGNIGIGTTVPSFALDVRGTIYTTNGTIQATVMPGGFSASNNLATGSKLSLQKFGSYAVGDTAGILDFTDNGAVTRSSIAVKHTETTGNGRAITFSSTANGSTTLAEYMRIDQNGNVGIGTSAPNTKLEIKNGTAKATTATTDNLWLSSSDATNLQALRFGIGSDATAANRYSYIQSEEMGVAYRNLVLNSAGGNVGIGTTSPTSTLDVNGVITAASYTYSVNTSATINLATTGAVELAPSTNITISFTNAPPAGDVRFVTIRIAPTAAVTVTWPSVEWIGGTAAATSLTSGKKYFYSCQVENALTACAIVGEGY